MELKIKLLTPLWTGDIDKKCTEIRENALVGSIRWWFRVFLRKEQIDCESKQFDSKKYFKELTRDLKKEIFTKDDDLGFELRTKLALKCLGYCPECLIFGTTGWKRRISLRVKENEKGKTSQNKDFAIFFEKSQDSKYKKKKQQVIYPGEPITIEIISIDHIDGERYFKILAYLLKEISKIGGLGAKVQNGFGIFDVEVDNKIVNEGKRLLGLIIKNLKKGHQSIKNKPNLKNFFWFEGNLDKRKMEEFFSKIVEVDISGEEKVSRIMIGEAIKNDIKTKIRKKINEDDELDLELKEKYLKHLFDNKDTNLEVKIEINASNIYPVNDYWRFKIWGWIVEKNNSKNNSENKSNEIPEEDKIPINKFAEYIKNVITEEFGIMVEEKQVETIFNFA